MVSQVADQVIAIKMFSLYMKYLLSKTATTNTLADNYGGFNKLVKMTNKSKQQKPPKLLIPSPNLY